MNISTGGPHILLFERDQQLTALASSEFQLAGYEYHSARTAVEVFDALARYPIRMVLVDLAQAAAARREFWVALDTQRRGRGVHVLTFRCFNLAGYGPQDPDDHSQYATPDMEVDGMAGLMKLVDAVGTRVPGAGTITNTVPRVPKVTPQQAPAAPQATRNGTPPISSGTASRPAAESPANRNSATRNSGLLHPQQTVNMPAAQTNNAGGASAAPGNGNAASAKSASYTDKIRAVLYPNQRPWSPQGPPNTPTQQENRPGYETPESTPTAASANDFTALQRLANGQAGTEGIGESGLAQLSRLAQASRPAASSHEVVTQRPPTAPVPSPIRTQIETELTGVNYASSQTAPQPVQVSERIGSQPLRASPIQDLPMDRVGNTQTVSDGGRRPDVLSRTNYGQTKPLASISPPAQTPLPVSSSVESTVTQERLDPLQVEPILEEEYREEEAYDVSLEGPYDVEPDSSAVTDQEEPLSEQPEESKQINPAQNNAALFDIMQSLPPMPPVTEPPQAIQPQVLNGRATRTLGSVLLSGHLVPQNRLEVAQNIQRMLRGVDLNYQLGEILLMFKLLTPDQLLAASLVSYGLITTTQISALGRIRQELHSIGLEYDLESLIILFRILTPEQLREAKIGQQG